MKDSRKFKIKTCSSLFWVLQIHLDLFFRAFLCSFLINRIFLAIFLLKF